MNLWVDLICIQTGKYKFSKEKNKFKKNRLFFVFPIINI